MSSNNNININTTSYTFIVEVVGLKHGICIQDSTQGVVDSIGNQFMNLLVDTPEEMHN